MHSVSSTRRLASAFLAASLLVLAAGAQQLEIDVINVDQGLAVFVKGPTGVRVLIDGGNPGAGNSIVQPFLQSKGVTALDYTVMTHWHTDHFGGLTDIHNSTYKPLVAAWDRGNLDRPSNGYVTSYLSAVGTKRATPVVGQVLDLGGGASATVVTRDGAYPGGSVSPTGDENAHSLGLVIRFGDFELYVAGDLTAGGLGTPNVEGPASAAIGQVEVAVASHHGSASSSSSSVCANLDPSLVVHSAGHDNPYGHPAEVTVDNWNTPGSTRVQWCTTDGDTNHPTVGGDPGGFNAVLGHVFITSDGNTFRAASSSHPEFLDFATFEQPGVLAAPTQIAINELLVDPLASVDATGEWIELANIANQRLDLGGLQFVSGAQSFTLRSRVLLDPGAFFLVGLDGRAARNGNVFPGVGAPWGQFSLPNSSGSLLLRAANSAAIESVNWGGSGVAITPGASAERIVAASPPSAANFATALGAWAGGDLGTPLAFNGNSPPSGPTCPLPVAYGTPKLTSNLTLPYITWSGTPDLASNDFVITLVDGMPLQSTIGFWGVQPDDVPFLGGRRLVKPVLMRLPLQVADASGSISYSVPIDASMPGTTRYYQFWFRDPLVQDGTNIGLSSALAVRFCPLQPPPAAGQLVITEFMKDPTFVADSAGEWLELYNTTSAQLDIEGWTLRDDAGNSTLIANGGNGVLVPAHAYVVLAANGNPALNGGVTALYDYDGAAFVLGNADDEIVLEAPGGVEIDRVMYDNGLLWPDVPGQSISLTAGVLDAIGNDDGNSWCHSATPLGGSNPDTGTPNAANETCP